MAATTQLWGIDTSILVRLVTGHPTPDAQRCIESMSQMLDQGSLFFASNQVVGETYVVLQHHYQVKKPRARNALFAALTSGLVRPSGGTPVLDVLQDSTGASRGAGLMDQLIALDYAMHNLSTLTLDRRMSRIPGVTRLETRPAPR